MRCDVVITTYCATMLGVYPNFDAKVRKGLKDEKAQPTYQQCAGSLAEAFTVEKETYSANGEFRGMGIPWSQPSRAFSRFTPRRGCFTIFSYRIPIRRAICISITRVPRKGPPSRSTMPTSGQRLGRCAAQKYPSGNRLKHF